MELNNFHKKLFLLIFIYLRDYLIGFPMATNIIILFYFFNNIDPEIINITE